MLPVLSEVDWGMANERSNTNRFTDINIAYDDASGNLSDEEALLELQKEMKEAGIPMEVEEK
ncbi:predicted protein [Cyanophage PSS2]|uniref:hypothetical protein n=1 Tax=Cyanophage PSS2 TaxID=658401 RepID=UPI0001B03FF5|nr:hypothetical protein PSS2_gp032 [Cyanophage PSS2]ACT65594.1 hypothetical protein [Cyanophage PSS2]ACY75737.1 predicted protein [Cyanophage PSS2]